MLICCLFHVTQPRLLITMDGVVSDYECTSAAPQVCPMLSLCVCAVCPQLQCSDLPKDHHLSDPRPSINLKKHYWLPHVLTHSFPSLCSSLALSSLYPPVSPLQRVASALRPAHLRLLPVFFLSLSCSFTLSVLLPVRIH